MRVVRMLLLLVGSLILGCAGRPVDLPDAAPRDTTGDAPTMADLRIDAPPYAPDLSMDGVPRLDYPPGCALNKTPITSSVACGSGGYAPKIYNAPLVCKPELHIVGNYEASSNHSITAPATVTFNAPRTGVTLVLASYEGVAWTVKVGPAASVSKIIVIGYESSTVTAPPGVAIDNRSASSPWCSLSGGSPTNPCVSMLEQEGYRLASFHYCYKAAWFTLN